MLLSNCLKAGPSGLFILLYQAKAACDLAKAGISDGRGGWYSDIHRGNDCSKNALAATCKRKLLQIGIWKQWML